jgi:hypothetical protein
MKYKKILYLTILFSCFTQAQITKGNWMIGGSGSFSSNTEYSKNTNNKYKSEDFSINADIGYFFINKLSTGVKINYYKTKPNYEGAFENSSYSLGPFVRYYFLKPEKIYNIFLESAYSWEQYNSNTFITNSQAFNISAGSTIYFNSSVGLEFFVQFVDKKYKDPFDTGVKRLQTGLGLQIYLENNN